MWYNQYYLDDLTLLETEFALYNKNNILIYYEIIYFSHLKDRHRIYLDIT
jgi:hypothetical protein